MLDKLEEVVRKLPLDDITKWDSLIVNRRKPHTYRVFTQIDDLRVCLHRFDTCDEHESFLHPHPWPGAFLILSGGYQMSVGYSQSRIEKPDHVMTLVLPRYAKYEIIDPHTWHSVTPLGTTYTIMVNGEPWSESKAHQDVRRTKGKDLDKMPESDLREHLALFDRLVGNYLTHPSQDKYDDANRRL